MHIQSWNAVIFDLDGTLLDTVGDIAESANRALDAFGYPRHSVASYRAYVGDGLVNLAKKVLPPGSRSEPEVQRFVDLYRDSYAVLWRATSGPFAGVSELLDGLAKRNVPMAVLSNKRDDFTRLCVRELLGSWHFQVVRGERPGVPLKPSPDAALDVARELGFSPGQCLYVGDSEIDVETAKRAGMGCVGVLWGFRPREILVKAGAEILISEPGELLHYLRAVEG
jgi:phosphoglycolate phosphatase